MKEEAGDSKPFCVNFKNKGNTFEKFDGKWDEETVKRKVTLPWCSRGGSQGVLALFLHGN